MKPHPRTRRAFKWATILAAAGLAGLILLSLWQDLFFQYQWAGPGRSYSAFNARLSEGEIHYRSETAVSYPPRGPRDVQFDMHPRRVPREPFKILPEWSYADPWARRGPIVHFPLLLPCATLAIASAWLWRRDARLRALRPGAICPQCGYDLVGLAVDARCPECGATKA